MMLPGDLGLEQTVVAQNTPGCVASVPAGH